jgi:hypothetical protein
MSLRAIISVCAALLVAACVSVPREPEPPILTLDAQGIRPTVSQLRIDFGRAQAGVIDTVSRLLDEGPETITTTPECGAGPITAAAWGDGLTLNFMDGSFVGWTSSDPELPVAGGFRAGQPRLEMPQVSFQVTSLGNEFSRSDIFGILTEDDTRIRLLWAGTTCFFR